MYGGNGVDGRDEGKHVGEQHFPKATPPAGEDEREAADGRKEDDESGLIAWGFGAGREARRVLNCPYTSR
jgi:hypothetical protein